MSLVYIKYLFYKLKNKKKSIIRIAIYYISFAQNHFIKHITMKIMIFTL